MAIEVDEQKVTELRNKLGETIEDYVTKNSISNYDVLLAISNVLLHGIRMMPVPNHALKKVVDFFNSSEVKDDLSRP